MKALFFIFSLLISQALLASEDLSPLGKIKSAEGMIHLYKGSYDSLETLVVAKSIKDENANYISAESSMETLLRVFPLKFSGSDKVYIVSVWTKGAHGEQVRILDPVLENMEVHRFKSSWAIELKFEDNKLIMNGKGDALQTKGSETPYQVYEDLVDTWSP